MDPASSAVMEALSTIRGVQDLSHQFGTKVLIARGGYSEVYRAEWLQSGTLAPVNVCYKVLKPPISDMPPVVEEVKKTMKHLKREMKAWKDLDHGNIVKFVGFAIGARGAVPEAALVSEWCSNGNLVQYLRRKPSCNRLPLLLDVARGLTYLHDHDPVVVHGDLKPLNILISEAGRAKLCDFGLSLIADGLTTGYTSSGASFTLRYCAPEVVESDVKTTSSDIYSFACSCAMILFDGSPFPSLKNDAQLLKALKSGRPVWDWKQSSPVEKILSSCCAFSPDARPTMGEVFRSLVDTCVEPDSSPNLELSDLKTNLFPPLTDGLVDSHLTLGGHHTNSRPSTSSRKAAIEADRKVAPSPDFQNGISGEKQPQVQPLPKPTPELLDTGVDEEVASVAISSEARDVVLGLEPLPGLLWAHVSPESLRTVQTGKTTRQPDTIDTSVACPKPPPPSTCLPSTISLQQKAGTPRQKINDLAAGGDLAVLTLRGINGTADWCPPLKNATSAALFIFDEVKNFKVNAKEWTNFGEYIASTMAKVASAIESDDVSEAKSWVESATELDGALQKIRSEIEGWEKVEKRLTIRKTFSHLRDPGRIHGLKKDFDEALSSFQVMTNLIIGTKLASTEHRPHDDKTLDSQDPSYNLTRACLEGTRVDLIEHIMAWCRNTGDGENRLMLLTAVAGAGKTSIALTIAERCVSEEDVSLLLRFFFKAGKRSRPNLLFSGIAQALADHDPAYRTFITSTLRNDPSLPTASFATQFKELVALPLLCKPPPSDRPMVIIIDALDECDKDVLEPLAEILGDEVPRLPSSIKFFITSRQFVLVNRYLSPDYPINRLTIDLLDEANVQDCTRFIRFQLQKLRELRRSLQRTLQDEDNMVQEISKRANGLFIWISIIFRYMEVANKNPMRTLESLLDTGAERPEVPAEKMMDDLYISILKKCAWEDEDFAHDYPVMMGAMVVAQQPLSITAWDAILSPFLKSSARYVLAELAPLLSGVGDHYTPVRILHQSFHDFIVGRINLRTISPHCSPVGVETENARVALRCIEILNQDFCSVKGLGLIENLSEKDEMPRIPPNELSEHFHYACRHIVYHLSGVQEPSQGLARSVAMFLSQEATRWMEVCVRMETYVSISSLPEWAKLAVVHRSKDAVGTLANVLIRLRRNLVFFSRFQEAYEAANDTVVLYRCLFSVTSGSYAPHLAKSLHSLHKALSNLGRHSEALPFIEECVKIQRQLVGVNLGSYTPDLAISLRNLYVALSDLGRHSEALPFIGESVQLWRYELVGVNPGSYTPDLAMSLRNLYLALSGLGWHSEALPFMEECVKIRRQLVGINPGSYTPDLAISLNSLYVALSNLGRHSEALPFIEECVKIQRQLVGVNPGSYTPNLATSLRNQYLALSNLGWHSEALPFIEECVKIRHQLVGVDPGSYTPDLAMSLRNLYLALSGLGRHSEALPFIEECVKIRRQLVGVNPGAYTPKLAKSVKNLRNALSNLGRHSEAQVVHI